MDFFDTVVVACSTSVTSTWLIICIEALEFTQSCICVVSRALIPDREVAPDPQFCLSKVHLFSWESSMSNVKFFGTFSSYLSCVIFPTFSPAWISSPMRRSIGIAVVSTPTSNDSQCRTLAFSDPNVVFPRFCRVESWDGSWKTSGCLSSRSSSHVQLHPLVHVEVLFSKNTEQLFGSLHQRGCCLVWFWILVMLLALAVFVDVMCTGALVAGCAPLFFL